MKWQRTRLSRVRQAAVTVSSKVSRVSLTGFWLAITGLLVRGVEMILPRDHQYLSICNDCEWYRYHGRAPFAAMRDTKRHSVRNPGHKATVIDLQSLECVTTYILDAIPQVNDRPPY